MIELERLFVNYEVEKSQTELLCQILKEYVILVIIHVKLGLYHNNILLIIDVADSLVSNFRDVDQPGLALR